MKITASKHAAARDYTARIVSTATGKTLEVLQIAALTEGQARSAAWEYIRDHYLGTDINAKVAPGQYENEDWQAEREAAEIAAGLMEIDTADSDRFHEISGGMLQELLAAAYRAGQASK